VKGFCPQQNDTTNSFFKKKWCLSRFGKELFISKLYQMLSVSNAEQLVHAFMTSRLDYCNALLGGCPARL